MKNTIKVLSACCFVWLLNVSCDTDEKDAVNATVVGTWTGDKSEFRINPDGIIPPFTRSEDNFNVKLEFKNNGELVLTDHNQVTKTGTYQMTGRELTINIDYEFEYINMSGVYRIEELTSTNLRASIEKEGTYTHHETGTSFDGTVEATLFFDRQSGR